MTVRQSGPDDIFPDAVYQLVSSPAKENYLRARGMVVAHHDYAPYSDDLKTVEQLIEQENPDEAMSYLADHLVNLLLSPRAHLLAASIARSRDDKERHGFEMHFAMALSEGIKSTGHGTRENPHVICRITDEYDFLMYIEKRITSQNLMTLDDRKFDVHSSEDGTDILFDITDQTAWLDRKLHAGESWPAPL